MKIELIPILVQSRSNAFTKKKKKNYVFKQLSHIIIVELYIVVDNILAMRYHMLAFKGSKVVVCVFLSALQYIFL